MKRSAIAAAALALTVAAPPASQAAIALQNLMGAIRAAGFTAVTMPEDGAGAPQTPAGGAVETPAGHDPVIGVFQTEGENGADFWFWKQSAADLSSQALRDTTRAGNKMGVRPLNDLLSSAAPGAWAVVSRPTTAEDGTAAETPAFLFTSGDKKEIFFASIPQEKVYGEGDAAVRLPLTMQRSGEALIARYGGPDSGMSEVHRFSGQGNGDEILGIFEYRTDQRTRRPTLDRARIYTGRAGIDDLLNQPGFKDTPAGAALAGDAGLLNRMSGEMERGRFFSVTVGQGGTAQFNLHTGADDKKGSAYLYVINNRIMEVNPPQQ